jgi:hypothetical protein
LMGVGQRVFRPITTISIPFSRTIPQQSV